MVREVSITLLSRETITARQMRQIIPFEYADIDRLATRKTPVLLLPAGEQRENLHAEP